MLSVFVAHSKGVYSGVFVSILDGRYFKSTAYHPTPTVSRLWNYCGVTTI